jgi:hypothetical protein
MLAAGACSKFLDHNLASVRVRLTAADLKQIDAVLRVGAVSGDWHDAQAMKPIDTSRSNDEEHSPRMAPFVDLLHHLRGQFKGPQPCAVVVPVGGEDQLVRRGLLQ